MRLVLRTWALVALCLPSLAFAADFDGAGLSPLWAVPFAGVLLSIALARPQTNQGLESETTRGRNVLLALDLSRSMLVTDLKNSRMAIL